MPQEGFSLLEVVITLTVASVLGAMLFQFVGVNMEKSSRAISTTKKELLLQKTMEEISRDYRLWMSNSPNDSLVNFESQISAVYGGGGDILLGTTWDYTLDATTDGNTQRLLVTLSALDDNNQVQQQLLALFTK